LWVTGVSEGSICADLVAVAVAVAVVVGVWVAVVVGVWVAVVVGVWVAVVVGVWVAVVVGVWVAVVAVGMAYLVGTTSLSIDAPRTVAARSRPIVNTFTIATMCLILISIFRLFLVDLLDDAYGHRLAHITNGKPP